MSDEPATPRIPPLEPPYEPKIEALLAKWMPPGGEVEPLRLFRTLAVHDDLASRMRPLGAGILGHGRVDPRLREIVIHRTCALCGAEYEWGIHAVAFARPLGFSEEQLASTVYGSPDDGNWSAQEAAAFRLADQLHQSGRTSDELFAELAEHLTPDQVLELTIIAGWYHTISFVIGTASIEPEEWAERFPAAPRRNA